MPERQKQIFGTREPIDSLRLEGTQLTFLDSVIASICLVTYDYLTDYFKNLYRDWQIRRQFRERQIQFIVENPTPGVKSTLNIHPENSLFRLNNPERAAFNRILKSRRS